MKPFLINLDGRGERLGHMQRQFDRYGIPYQRIAATDVSKMSEEEFASLRAEYGRRAHRHPMSRGQIGCLLSHQEAWRTIGAGTEPWGCVFEDDVHLAPAMAHLLAGDTLLPAEPDIIRFETTRQGVRLGRRTGTWACEDDTFSFAPITGPAWGAAAYAIKREIAQWLAGLPPWLCRPTDSLLFDKPISIADEIVTWQMSPAPCVQDKYHPHATDRLGFDSETEDVALRLPGRFDRQRERLRSVGRRLLGKSLVEFSVAASRMADARWVVHLPRDRS